MDRADQIAAGLTRMDGITARMDELERMMDGMEFGDRRDGLEAEYDQLLDQLFHFNSKAA